MRCANWKMVAKNEGAEVHTLARIRCKQWSCDYCSAALQRQWRAHIQHEIARLGGQWSFITVTASREAHQAKNTVAVLRVGLEALHKRLRRLWGDYEYVRVFERHQSGQYHAHLIMSVYPPDAHKVSRKTGRYNGRYVRTLKAACVGVGLGFMVDITPIGSVDEEGFALITAYVTKYLTKAGQDYAAPKGLRRVQASRGFAALNKHSAPGGDWFVTYGGYTEAEFSAKVLAGVTVYDADEHRQVTWDDYEAWGTYPSAMIKPNK